MTVLTVVDPEGKKTGGPLQYKSRAVTVYKYRSLSSIEQPSRLFPASQLLSSSHSIRSQLNIPRHVCFTAQPVPAQSI